MKWRRAVTEPPVLEKIEEVQRESRPTLEISKGFVEASCRPRALKSDDAAQCQCRRRGEEQLPADREYRPLTPEEVGGRVRGPGAEIWTS